MRPVSMAVGGEPPVIRKAAPPWEEETATRVVPTAGADDGETVAAAGAPSVAVASREPPAELVVAGERPAVKSPALERVVVVEAASAGETVATAAVTRERDTMGEQRAVVRNPWRRRRRRRGLGLCSRG